MDRFNQYRWGKIREKLKLGDFYALRRTATTMVARSGDPFAVQRLLGHVDLTMATLGDVNSFINHC